MIHIAHCVAGMDNRHFFNPLAIYHEAYAARADHVSARGLYHCHMDARSFAHINRTGHIGLRLLATLTGTSFA